MPEPSTETLALTGPIPAIEPPVIWLLGKVQSGKSSIVQALTGTDKAAVGSGFRPCTRTAALFPFPAEQPVVQFLDTRGLGEVQYDPAQDLAFAEQRAQLLCCVMKAMDSDQDAVLKTVHTVRKRHPDWPVVVAQTTLHDGYAPGTRHAIPYPFDGTTPEGSGDLSRALQRQRKLFDGLPGKGALIFVPIDFTQPGDGLEPRSYGLDALLTAIEQAAPLGLAASLREAAAASERPALAERDARCDRSILRHAMAAAAVDVVPFAGIVGVPGIQAALLRTLAQEFAIDWDRQSMTEFGSALGLGTVGWLAAGFGLRQLGKLVPGYGQTVGAAAAAASSFAATYAIGKASLVYLGQRQRGDASHDGVVEAYRVALRDALTMARRRNVDAA